MIEMTKANLKLMSFLVPVGVIVGVLDGEWVGVCVGESKKMLSWQKLVTMLILKNEY